MTEKQLELTKKYLGDYSEYCADRLCGMDCPVFARHKVDPRTSCFLIYCNMRENGEIKKKVEA